MTDQEFWDAAVLVALGFTPHGEDVATFADLALEDWKRERAKRWPFDVDRTPNFLAILKCKSCGWQGRREFLIPLGSVARLHCPDCHSEYGSQDGVPDPGKPLFQQPLDSKTFRIKKEPK